MQNHIRKNEKDFITSLSKYLRDVSRKVLKVDTQEEILNYLVDSFIKEVNCDFIVISRLEQGRLVLSNIRGDFGELNNLFPQPIEDVNPLLLNYSLRSDDDSLDDDSPVRKLFERKGIESWFTIPIAEESDFYGLVIAGFYDKTALYEQMQSTFDELGNYTAIALKIIKRNNEKENSQFDLGWLSKNLTFNDSLYELVNKVISFAGKESKSQYAAIYLLNEEKDSLIYQEPSYGYLRKNKVISIDKENLIEDYLPNVEKVGKNKITIPITSNLEILGVIFAEKKSDSFYTGHDLELLQMYANYFSVMYQNNQLRTKEREQRENLEKIVDLQQQFIQKTVESDNFTEINTMLSDLLNTPVILFDGFMNVVDYYIEDDSDLLIDDIYYAVRQFVLPTDPLESSFQLEIKNHNPLEVTPIHDGNEFHAFIAIKSEIDFRNEFLTILYTMINNIYSLQFIKRKINRNTTEQIKYNFIQKLLVPEIESVEEIIEYASDFNWDLYKTHRVSVISIREESIPEFSNLIERKAQTTSIFEQIKELVNFWDNNVITAILNNQLVLFTPVKNESSVLYWSKLYKYITQDTALTDNHIEFVIGIGGKASRPEEYYENYQKASETSNILQKENNYQNYAFFDNLGSYTILDGVKENLTSKMFVQNYLKDLYLLSNKQQLNLYETLRIYLQNSGNISQTADDLFLHRSTLTYRLNKIKDELNVDIEDSNEQFNFMLAFKLADLYSDEVFLEDNS